MTFDAVPAAKIVQTTGNDGQSSPLVLPLADLDRGRLALAGGKGANLGELVRAGFRVPEGFCVTTRAYKIVADATDLAPVFAGLATSAPTDVARLDELAATARERLLATAVPEEIRTAIAEAYVALGKGQPVPVAVRSSATAEDLPGASFAGQQDTYLNVVGAAAVVDAVQRCWASLWTSRAVTYRSRNQLDQQTVRLAVVVQRMVDAAVAGILFTANPLTGRRRQAVIDASPGLGEAVVSGAVNPDHFVVAAATGEILERRLGDKRLAVVPSPEGGTRRVELSSGEGEACLSGEQLRALVALGQRVEAHFGAAQDLEFAVDRAGTLWLTQARPITTLFPLPDTAPLDDRDLRVYFNFSVAQGVFRPFTPMGIQVFRLLMSSIATVAGVPPRDPVAGPGFVAEAAGRIFFDVTALVRSRPGRRLLSLMLKQMEARSEPMLRALLADPRLSVRPVVWHRALPRLLRLLVFSGIPLRILAAWLAPAAARASLDRLGQDLRSASTAPANATPAERLELAERLLLTWPARIFPQAVGPVIAGLGSFAIAGRLLAGLASPDERDAIKRALPRNPTTEMDLALGALARQAGAQAAARAALQEQAPSSLAAAYRSGALPAELQRGLSRFLEQYGHRAVAEIDLGMPRWSDDPAPLLATLTSQLKMPEMAAPDAQFRALAAQADAMVRELAQRAARRGQLRGRAVRVLLGRGRALAGLREMPKFLIVLLIARTRALILSVGEELARTGRLAAADDIFFLTLPEAREVLQTDGRNARAVVRERRARYADELGRRHLPRLLRSDGSEPELEVAPIGAPGEILRGVPASAGQVTGRARVILDPAEARLEPGEILVAPSTDPGWTPLFLTASGLVMEMGGAMSHGAVVAREYGIPAVVGVPEATERIADGQEVTVDGTAGVVIIATAASA
jgi:phosphohistidine swiveling domain-containing protein